MASTLSYKFYDQPAEPEDVAAQLIDGLRHDEKYISPKFFYDAKGSQLFTKITQTQEYYPTRTEIGLLRKFGGEMARCVGEDCLLVEYGSGSSEKIRILLDTIKPRIYAPLDISREYLDESANAIAVDYPWLEVRATCVDYSQEFDLPFSLSRNTTGFFPGSSIGNFDPDSAVEFLGRVKKQLGHKGGLLIGVDLKKDHQILNRAYNDGLGITAKFNLNALSHLNHAYEATFNLDLFEHYAGYNAELGCIQMFLESRQDQVISVAREQFSMKKGERIHTENSYKYSTDEFVQMAQTAGYENYEFWNDDKNWFGIFYLS